MTYRQETLSHLGPDGFHDVAYREWGAPDNPNVLVCVHGISRNGADFDYIAEVLADTYRVVCPDMPGRGASDWMDDKTIYAAPLYLSVCANLIARTGASSVDWIGTSMGGRIGMTLAAAANTPIRKLVINDIGPHVAPDGRKDNFAHFGTDPRFATQTEAVAYVRSTRAAFGPTTEAAWVKFCDDSLRQTTDGQWTLHYDPDLKVTASSAASGDSWDTWDKITCPTMLLWGLKSKLLLPPTVNRMRSTGPKAKVFEVPYAGHCPRLENDEQIFAVRDFLLA
jgi:pimeloyl-ACP methyl ester carboxylesterase